MDLICVKMGKEAVMITMLHIADLHFGRPFIGEEIDIGEKLRSMQRETFREVCDFCINRNIDVLLIAGDLFDHERFSLDLQYYIRHQIYELISAGITVVYCSGNHDKLFIKETLKNLKGLIFFDSDYPQVHEIILSHSRHLRIVGCGYCADRNVVKDFPLFDEGVTVGIAHANISSPEQPITYMATTKQDIEHKGYNYFALGHIHKRQQVAKNCWYSGSMMPLHINEGGEHGGILVELTSEQTTIQPISFLSGARYYKWRFPLPHDIDTAEMLLEQLNGWFDEEWSVKNNRRHALVEIELEGVTAQSSLFTPESVASIEQMLSQHLEIMRLKLDVSRLRYVEDIQQLREEHTVLGYMLKAIQQLPEASCDEFKIETDMEELKKWLENEAIRRLR